MPWATREGEEGNFTLSVMMPGQRHLTIECMQPWIGFHQRLTGQWPEDGKRRGPRQQLQFSKQVC
jgi:hypothetical protein